MVIEHYRKGRAKRVYHSDALVLKAAVDRAWMAKMPPIYSSLSRRYTAPELVVSILEAGGVKLKHLG